MKIAKTQTLTKISGSANIKDNKHETSIHFRASLGLQKKAVKELKAMFDATSYFETEQITNILMVLISFFF